MNVEYQTERFTKLRLVNKIVDRIECLDNESIGFEEPPQRPQKTDIIVQNYNQILQHNPELDGPDYRESRLAVHKENQC